MVSHSTKLIQCDKNSENEVLSMKSIIKSTIEMISGKKDNYENAARQQLLVWNGSKPEKQTLLLKVALNSDQQAALPSFNLKEIHFDSEKMLLYGLRDVMQVMNGGREAVPSVRANMGAGIFPSILGVESMLFEDKMPWVKGHRTKEQLSKVGPEDLKISDEFKRGLEHMAYMAQQLEGTGCMVYPMDLQGAFDTAHIVYGDAIFYDLYDDPGFLHHLLELCCQAIFIGMEECFKIMPGSDKKIAHYNGLVIPRTKGGIKVSEDTSTLVSEAHIEEFVSPYLHKLLEHFGGGYVHYCGSNPHLFKTVMKEPLAYGLNFGNPEKHDMPGVLKTCAEKGMIYYGAICRQENEPLEDYFRKYLSASGNNGKHHLLLEYSCKWEEKEALLDAWEKAALA